MELYSNCCGANIIGMDNDGIGRCSDCKENCGVDTTCVDCGNQELAYKEFIAHSGLCDLCSYAIKNL